MDASRCLATDGQRHRPCGGPGGQLEFGDEDYPGRARQHHCLPIDHRGINATAPSPNRQSGSEHVRAAYDDECDDTGRTSGSRQSLQLGGSGYRGERQSNLDFWRVRHGRYFLPLQLHLKM